MALGAGGMGCKNNNAGGAAASGNCRHNSQGVREVKQSMSAEIELEVIWMSYASAIPDAWI